MNIAFLTPAFKSNQNEAISKTLISLAIGLQQKGHKVVIISNRTRNLPRYEVVANNLEIFRPYKYLDLQPRIGINPFFFFNLILAHVIGVKFVEKKLNIRFDILHGFSASSFLMLRCIIGKFFSKNQNIKLIHSFKSISQYYFATFGLKSFSKFFNSIIVQTNLQKKFLLSHNVKEKKIQIIPSHIDIKKFKPLDKKMLKLTYHFADTFVITYYGHFLKEKGVVYLLQALNNLKFLNKRKFICLLIWSGLGNKNSYDKSIRQLHLVTDVKIIGPDVRLTEYLNVSDLIVLPYPSLLSTEANPSCILESMACKTPVLTSKIPELESFLFPGKNIIMAKSEDPNDIANKINDIMINKFPMRSIIDSAYSYSQNFTIENSVKRHEEVYHSIKK